MGSLPERVILHVDLDAFFAAAETLAAPALKGKALVVGGRPGERGVVASASYEAREHGVRSGMSLVEAHRLCPHAVFLPCHPPRYFDLSTRFLRLLLDYTPMVEMASIDEAFLDASGLVEEVRQGALLAASIRSEVLCRLSLSCSVGVGENKLLAKTASALGKPAGIALLDREAFLRRFGDQSVSSIYGIGAATRRKLEAMGIVTVDDLSDAPESLLHRMFGVIGPALKAAARGEDRSPLVPYHQRPRAKSIGHEYTLPRDSRDPSVLRAVLLGLCEKVSGDLRAVSLMSREVRLKVRMCDWTLIGRQSRLARTASSTRALFQSAWGLYSREVPPRPVRMVGVSAASLSDARGAPFMEDLFEARGDGVLDSAIDRIRDSFGGSAIRRASLIGSTTSGKGRSER